MGGHRRQDIPAQHVLQPSLALDETTIGLFKAEVIWNSGPWRNVEDVEFGTLEWVDWFNIRRLLSSIGNVPPVEFEERY